MFGGLYQRIAVAAVAAAAGVSLIGGAALAWSGGIWGRPASFEAGSTDGYYVWQDKDGMHLRTTDSSGVYTYSGVLRTRGKFTDVHLVKAERDDHVEVVDGGKAVRFQFKTAEGIDGIDFHVDGGRRLYLRLDQNGKRIDPANIFLGEDSAHPDHDPFVIRRERERDHQSSAPKTVATPVAGASQPN